MAETIIPLYKKLQGKGTFSRSISVQYLPDTSMTSSNPEMQAFSVHAALLSSLHIDKWYTK